MSDAPVLDPSALMTLSDMVGGDPAFVAEMIDTFLDETPSLLATMRASLAAGNAVELRRAAHSLKSNSATFGATTLADLCHRLEDLGKAASFDGADVLVERVDAEYQQVEPALLAARPQV